MTASLDYLQESIRSSKLTLSAVVEGYLKNSEKSAETNAFVEVWAEEARSRAKKLDQKFQDGEKMGSLYGVVFSLKDVIAFEGKSLTAGSRILQGYVSPFSATVVERILAEDGIIIGSTNCDEFAMGSDNSNSVYGPTLNAVHQDRVPGGSSGGAAASVALDTCLVGIGSDTGGSVRQPAAFHGLYGFKPSYGRLSRHGLIAYASSFDQIGLIGSDMKAIFDTYHVMSGPDGYDSTLVDASVSTAEIKKEYKVGWLQEAFYHRSLDSDMQVDCERVKNLLGGQNNIDLELCSFGLLDLLVPAYYILTSAEASSNLSRFDGIRYGHRSAEAGSLQELYVQTRSRGFGSEVKKRIMLGAFVLSEGYFDAYFGKAQKLRTKIRWAFDQLFGEYDFVLLPTAPTFPWTREAGLSNVEVYLSDIFSILANLLGVPSFSLPIRHEESALFYGIQVLSKQYAEEQLEHFLLQHKALFDQLQ